MLIVQVDTRHVRSAGWGFTSNRRHHRALHTHQLLGQMHHNRSTLPYEHTKSILRTRGNRRPLPISIPGIKYYGSGILLLGQLDDHPAPSSWQFDLSMQRSRGQISGSGDADEKDEKTQTRRIRFNAQNGSCTETIGLDERDEKKSSRRNAARGSEESLPTVTVTVYLPHGVSTCLRLHYALRLFQSLSADNRLLSTMNERRLRVTENLHRKPESWSRPGRSRDVTSARWASSFTIVPTKSFPR